MLPLEAVLNHLLNAQPEARERLARHAGRTVCLEAPPITARLEVGADGFVKSAPDNHVADVRLTIDPTRVPLFLTDSAAALKSVRIEGDAEFAQTISILADTLRWDAEEDLSRVIGDGAAHRAMGVIRGLGEWAKDAAGRLTGTTAAYLADEAPVLVRRAAAETFAADVAAVRDDGARLEKRIEMLEGRRRS